LLCTRSVDVYEQFLAKAKGDVAALPMVCTEIPGPGGEIVYRIDDIIGEASQPSARLILVMSIISDYLIFVIPIYDRSRTWELRT
jgi:hypothetical protein